MIQRCNLKPHDLLAAAEALLEGSRRPSEANLRRAQSTVYYALFHCLAKSAADSLVGAVAARRSRQAWRDAYRALDHGTAKKACSNRIVMPRFPECIQNFAFAFVNLQERRHAADYDPLFRITKSEIRVDIELADDAINALRSASRQDQIAFSAHCLFRKRA